MRGESAAAVLLLLGACHIQETDWPKKAAKAQCEFHRRCDTSWFYRNYESMKECVEVSTEWIEDRQATDYETCNFSPKNARKCLHALDDSCKEIGREYEDVEETCFLVYDCADTLQDTSQGTRLD